MKLIFKNYNEPNKELIFSVASSNDNPEEEEKSSDLWQSELKSLLAAKGIEFFLNEAENTYTVIPCPSLLFFFSDDIKNLFVNKNRMTLSEWNDFVQAAIPSAVYPAAIESRVDILASIPKALASHIVRQGFLGLREQRALKQTSKKQPQPNYKTLLKLHFPDDFQIAQELGITSYQTIFEKASKRDYQHPKDKDKFNPTYLCSDEGRRKK